MNKIKKTFKQNTNMLATKTRKMKNSFKILMN